jgi:hypothetical protein
VAIVNEETTKYGSNKNNNLALKPACTRINFTTKLGFNFQIKKIEEVLKKSRCLDLTPITLQNTRKYLALTFIFKLPTRKYYVG